MENIFLILFLVYCVTIHVAPLRINYKLHISRTLQYMYVHLPYDATEEEKRKFYPIHEGSFYDDSKQCSEEEFYDEEIEDEMTWISQPKSYRGIYCYPRFKLSDSEGHEVDMAVVNSWNMIAACDKRDECESDREDDTQPKICYVKSGFRFIGVRESEYEESSFNGICVIGSGVPDVLSETYYSLPPAERDKHKQTYAVDDKTPCETSQNCANNQWCLVIDPTFAVGERRCFRMADALPKTYEEGPIIITPQHFDTCKSHNDCTCTKNDCTNELRKCFTSPELKLVYRDAEKKELRDGFCILANPVAFTFYPTYIKHTSTSEKYKYLPVGFRQISGNQKIAECSQNKPCGDGEFCGTVYDYTSGRQKSDGNLRHCFPIPSHPDTSQSIVIQPDEYGLKLCNETIRCKADGSWKCLVNPEWNFQTPAHSNFNGLCVKAHPVADVFIKQFESLPNNAKLEEMKKFLPVDYEGLHQTNPLKKCAKNEDCQIDNGQFCGTVYDYTGGRQKSDENLRHCFPIPSHPDTSQSIVIQPDEYGLKLCNETIRCKADESWKCLVNPEWNFQTPAHSNLNGLCVKAHPVADVFIKQFESLPNNAKLEEMKKFLPVDYEGLHQTNPLKKCAKNEDCQIDNGQFCGAVYDYFDNGPKTDWSRCFAVPQSSFETSSLTVHIPRNMTNLLFCNSISDCRDDEILGCGLKTGWIFVGIKDGKRFEYKGVCFKGMPLGFVYSDTFFKLANDVEYQQKTKYLAVDPLKTCTTNKDCNSGQFCGHPFDFSNRLANPNNLYCFSNPQIDEKFRISTKIGVSPDEVELKLCNIPSDCNFEEHFCNTETGQKYVEMKTGANEIAVFNGVCMKADICTVNEYNEQFKWSFGMTPTNLKNSCDSDADCEGTRDTSNDKFQGYCKNSLAYHNTNLCCHRQVQKCEYGQIVGTGIRCGKTMAKNETLKVFAECNGGLEKVQKQETKSEKWCDSAASQCCQIPSAPTTFTQFCPDQQTPLFNEPKCMENGKCSQKIGSICQNGHCCPDARFNSTTRTLPKNQYSYTTNYPCLAGHRPAQFQYNAYCEKETGKVVIFGHLSVLNESLTRYLTDDEDPKKCQNDDDCSTDNSTICIYDPLPYCYYNPKRHVPLKSSNVVLITSLTIVGILIVIMASGAIAFFIWKKKSMKIGKNLESEAGKSSSKTNQVESKLSTESVSKKPTSDIPKNV